MNTLNIIIIIGSLGLGSLLAFLFFKLQRQFQLSGAKNVARDLIQDAEDLAQKIIEDAQLSVEEYEELEKEKLEHITEEASEKINKLKSQFDKESFQYNKKKQISQNYLKKAKSYFNNYENEFLKTEKEFEEKRSKQKNLQDQFVNNLISQSQEDPKKIIEEIIDQLKKETLTRITKSLQLYEEEFLRESEKKARQILARVIGRFERPYCPERGINNINFSSEEIMHRTLGPNFEYVEILEREIGVDLTPHKDRLFLNVSAFDPVRRELTRIVCEKMIHEKNLTPERINKLLYLSKKQLFKKIRVDGQRILKELKINNMHSAIRDKIGSLRYRYSFTQNQYFHVSEVGWLCGLLSSELGLSITDGRRAGLLHDVGKSMDHSIDGGHAVIGADFIEKHNEKEHIVHAVRAHHFDEQPQTDLAYLVIAADAISGARPGARKSTAESYTQKMYELEKVGQSFDEVHSTYILSAGREVRVIVDNSKVDDYRALELSKEIAQKIEAECTYPGQIRVTVVRKTAAVQYAK